MNLTIPKVTKLVADLTGNGSYALLIPTGANLTVTARGSSYWTNAATFTSPREPQGVQGESMDLGRFGWINLQILAGSPPQGVAGALVTTSVWDPGNSTYVQTSGFADSVGYANLSAPPGSSVVVTVTDPASGQTQNTTVTVRPSRSTFVDLPVMTGASSTVYWIASAQVNTVGVPIETTVRDPVSGGPLGQATVQVDNSFGEPVTSGTSTTNALGQFLLTAPVATGESFSVSDPGYSPNGTLLPLAGRVVRYREINLTGNGIIAGVVVDAGTGLPVDGATVSACVEAAAGACISVGTNASGGYWISLPPGLVGLQYSAVGYVQNQSLQV
ncbi:MAG: carboxypeptidase regulatory-like domain-containing protein, partial [Thermoplasmata archaeon]